MNIKTPPMPKPEGTFLVLGRNEAWNEETGQYTEEQILARDAQWLEMVRPVVEALQGICDEQDERQGYASYEAYDKARDALRNITED